MKYLLVLIVVVLFGVGCKEKNMEPMVVCLECGDSTFQSRSWVTVYDGETLEGAVKRMDSTYGTNIFTLCYLTMKGKHSGFCINCPDSCTTILTDGVDLRGVGINNFKQTIECDCDGKTYFPRGDDTWSADTMKRQSHPGFVPRHRDSKIVEDVSQQDLIKKIWYDNGIEYRELSPFDTIPLSTGLVLQPPYRINKQDTIYIYRDTCVGLGASSYHQKPSYFLEHAENSVFIRDTIYHDSQYRIYPNGFTKDSIRK